MDLNISSCILAGGKSSRFNYIDKALLMFKDNKALIETVYYQIINHIEEINIIANKNKNKYKNLFPSSQIFKDIFNDIGPLGGIHSALFYSKSDAVFIFGCDMPNISGELIIKMIQQFRTNPCDILVPFYKGQYEPLFAIYSKSILLKLHSHLSEKHSLKTIDFFEIVNTQKFMVDENTTNNPFLNINSKMDLNVK